MSPRYVRQFAIRLSLVSLVTLVSTVCPMPVLVLLRSTSTSSLVVLVQLVLVLVLELASARLLALYGTT
jgi:hypothetical protein